MTAPEFSRPVRLDRIGAGEHGEAVSATTQERAALARRFDLQAIDALEATYTLRREAAGIRARGHLSARVTQSCVVSGAPVPAEVDEDFDLRFVPEPGPDAVADEIELSEEECDTVFFEGGAIDLGEAAAETLALSLDPFPRSAEADQAAKDAGLMSEGEAGPLGALAGLKEKLFGKE